MPYLHVDTALPAMVRAADTTFANGTPTIDGCRHRSGHVIACDLNQSDGRILGGTWDIRTTLTARLVDGRIVIRDSLYAGKYQERIR